MPEGGKLEIAASHVELAGDAAAYDAPPGSYVCIDVSDTGCGMDENTLAHACEPFFTTKRLGLGSGLGLSMAGGFIRQSGGGMRIVSAPGAGTRVSIILPATPTAAAPTVEDDALQPEASGDLVLLVEDDPDVRQVVRQQLIDLGHPVIEAEDADQALTMVAQIPDIGIVVSDILMPGSRNGRQLAEQIRQEHPQMRIVLMSGYADEDGSRQDPPILAKPFVRHELAQALRNTGSKENP
jgi:CheY-like chemotaxis protein